MRFKRPDVEHSVTKSYFTSSLLSYILSSLAYAMGPLADGAVIGNFLGMDAVAAYGMVWPAILIFALIGAIVAGGSRNLYTGLVGQGKTDEANRVYTIAQILNLAASLALAAIVWIFSDRIAGLLGAQGGAAHLTPLISDYLRGFALGVPFMNGAKILSSFMSLDGDPERTFWSVVCMSAADVIGDMLVVLVFRGSMLGIGLATSIGNLVQFTVLSLHFLRKKRILRHSLPEFSRTFIHIRSIIVNGAPAGTTRLAAAAGGVLINHILASFAASEYIAAYSVQKSVASLVSCIYLGVADTVWTLSSIYYGEEDQNALRSLQRTAFRVGENTAIGVGMVLLIFSGAFARIYINDGNAQALKLAKEAIRVFACTLPLNLIVYSFMDYLIGTRHFTAANLYGYFVECGCIAPIVWIFVLIFGGRGVWFAGLLSLCVMIAAGGLFIILQPHGRNFDDKRLLLHEGFGVQSGRELSISASSMEEIIGMSRLSGLFCRENGISQRQAFILSLCVEEMAVNILKHGYNSKKTSRVIPQIDIRFLVKENEVILRIRDNGTPFDPVERYEMLQEKKEDPTKNLGIRLVMQMSKEVNYLNMNSTNNLIIRI